MKDFRLTEPVIMYEFFPNPGESVGAMNFRNRVWYLIAEEKKWWLTPLLWVMNFVSFLKSKIYEKSNNN